LKWWVGGGGDYLWLKSLPPNLYIQTYAKN
jgi:hypothetical protein